MTKNYLGIICMITAMLCFTLCNLIVASIGENYSMQQIIFFRGFGAMITCILGLIYKKQSATIPKSSLFPVIGIGLLITTSMFCLFSSFVELAKVDKKTIAITQIIALSSILYITALSKPILKEKVSLYKWLAVIIGLIGVIIIASPSGKFSMLGVGFAVAFSLIDAIVMISLRILGKKNLNPIVLSAWISGIMAIIGAIAMLFSAKTMPLSHISAFMVFGMGCGVGQILLVSAYYYAPASVVAPMIYSSALWAMLCDLVVWGTKPSLHVVIGAVVIAISGIYIIWQDNKKT